MPIFHREFEQRSVQWALARMGKITASEFPDVITDKKQELAAARHRVGRAKVGERLLKTEGRSLDGVLAIEQGRAREPDAAKHLAFVHDLHLEEIGFVESDCGRFGASPDRLVVGQSAGVEVKCPNIENHILYLSGGVPDSYKAQVQGSLWICEYEFWWFVSYHPNGPACIEKVGRDEPYIRKLAGYLEQFADEVDELERRMRAKGVWIAYERVTALDRERGEQANAELSEYVQGQFDEGNLGG